MTYYIIEYKEQEQAYRTSKINSKTDSEWFIYFKTLEESETEIAEMIKKDRAVGKHKEPVLVIVKANYEYMI